MPSKNVANRQNGNGTISLEEFDSFFENEMPFLSDEEVHEMFAHFDEDKSCQIDYEELIKIVSEKNYQTAKEELQEIKMKIEKKSDKPK